MEKAIVLLSGGLNSAVAAASMAKSHELHMLFANMQQLPQKQELESFDKLCQHFAVQHQWRVSLTHFKQVGGNAFVDPSREIERADSLQNDIASTFVPAMMPTLLDVATTFAFRIGAKHIIAGTSQNLNEPGPGSGVMYPDNRREFFTNYQYMIEAAMPARNKLHIETPLLDFSREEIVKLGKRLDVPFDCTWSCYRGEHDPCGTCFGCVNRASGFLRAGITDTLVARGETQSAEP